jgi:hypothetical protein
MVSLSNHELRTLTFDIASKNEAPIGPAQDQQYSGNEDEEDSFFTVLDKISESPRGFSLRIGSQSRNVFWNHLIIILKSAAKDLFQSLPLNLLFVRNVMEAEYECRSCEKIDVICKDAKTCGNQDGSYVERILHIGIWAGNGQDLILLEMTCCPDTNEFPHANQDQPYHNSREMRLGKNDQQKRSNKYWNPPDLFHIQDIFCPSM